MHACAVLLDNVLALVREEEQALAREDVDTMEELAVQRAGLLRQAWEQRQGYDEEALKRNLVVVRDANEKLHVAAKALHAKYREQQQNGRKQAKYFSAERNAYSQMQKSQFFNKIS